MRTGSMRTGMWSLWCSGRAANVPRLGRAIRGIGLYVGEKRQMSTADSQTGDVVKVLKERGFLYQCTSESVMKNGLSEPTVVYCGFDPTADTLHVGNLVGIMGLLHFCRHGHKGIALVGGATGCIGDPSGRNSERNKLDYDTLNKNVKGISATLERIFANVLPEAERKSSVTVLNNADWYRDKNIIDFLGEIGRHFRMSTMLSKDSVKSRMENEEGMSFIEFTYQIFQGYDFLHLRRSHGCTVQLGGSDQWGNIVSGCDLIRKATEDEMNGTGITFPLVTTSGGEKFGKSMGNAVWLESSRTSAFDLFQFFIRSEDADVEKFLKLFTFLELPEISKICEEHKRAPELKYGQRVLAREATAIIHGQEEAEKALKASETIYSETGNTKEWLFSLSASQVDSIFSHAATKSVPRDILCGGTVTDMLCKSGIFKSGMQAMKQVQNGGIYLNFERVVDPKQELSEDRDSVEGGVTLLRVGKKNFFLLRWE
eukprot:Nk52_evm72s221 gene=Nk52_evmTU72s221